MSVSEKKNTHRYYYGMFTSVISRPTWWQQSCNVTLWAPAGNGSYTHCHAESAPPADNLPRTWMFRFSGGEVQCARWTSEHSGSVCDKQLEIIIWIGGVPEWGLLTEQLCREPQQWRLTGAAVSVLTGPQHGLAAFCFGSITVSTLLASRVDMPHCSQADFWAGRDVLCWWSQILVISGTWNHKVLSDFAHWKLLCLVRDAPAAAASLTDSDAQVTATSSLQVRVQFLLFFLGSSLIMRAVLW